MTIRLLLLQALIISPLTWADSIKVELLATPIVLKEVPLILDGRELSTLNDFSAPKSRRDTIEHILMYQALVAGGIPESDIVVKAWAGDISYKRLLTDLDKGVATTFTNTVWREDVSSSYKNLVVSPPIQKKGEIFVGMYMHPKNPKFSSKMSMPNLIAVSSDQWLPDWRALKQLPLKHLYSTSKWEGMLKMVATHRADFMLIPFSKEEDLSFDALGITLKPRPGVKVRLAGSRGWVISKVHPKAELTCSALERGLKQLRESGRIDKAYIESGVINPNVEDWTVLNQPSP